jgi:hypothetical protein
LAVAANVSGVVIASSPGPSPAAQHAACSAAVPLATAIACLTPARSASALSKRATRGPWVILSAVSAAFTAARSSGSIVWCA